MTRIAAVLATSVLLGCSSLCACAQTAPSHVTKPRKKPSATEPTAQAPQVGSRPTINADGAVETIMPDGSKKLTRPGQCGYTMIAPDGQKRIVSCAQVQPATPPLPDQVSARWLEDHNSYLLDIIRSLLGNDQVSMDNYLRKDEPPTTTVYDKIRLRTELIVKLTAQQ